MRSITVASGVLILAVFAQDIFSGRPFYHSGMYAVALAALLLYILLKMKRWNALIVLGAALIGVAGLASSLLAPDNATIMDAPGATAAAPDLNGSLVFPLQADSPILLRRADRADITIGDRARYIGGFILKRRPRVVAFVEARDPNGARLTITQPTGTFLSPFLLFKKVETKLAVKLPVDSFNVPAAHRVVGAYLFSAKQIAELQHVPSHANGRSAVLFDVYTDAMHHIPHATQLIFSGTSALIGGIRLGCVVSEYPAVDVVSAPYLSALWIGGILFIAGVVLVRLKISPAAEREPVDLRGGHDH
ncbi:MAG: hypothetical protein M3Y21_05175 [Candidatus Eremiobacteraeota bacterium]|nr:hypothetical protein [Candidatus Eremiobacteraeota bacterium]